MLLEPNELLLEIAAYQGLPEGALNEDWTWDGSLWERKDCEDKDYDVTMFAEYDQGKVTWVISRECYTCCRECGKEDPADVEEILGESSTYRVAMREAEAAAYGKGWIS